MKKLIRKTRNLVIRSYEARDYEAWKRAHEAFLPPRNTWDTANTKPSLGKRVFQKALKRMVSDKTRDYSYVFGIFSRSGELIGNVSLMDISRQVFQNAYIGYHIFNRHWRKGYGREAVGATLDIGFRDLGLHRIEAGIAPHNKRSHALAKAVGLKREGLSKKRLFLRGQWNDMVIYAGLSEDFGIKWKG